MENPFQTIENKLNQLTGMVAELARKLDGNQPADHTPLDVSKAAQYLDIAKPTLYALTSKRLIPHKKRGKKLYFLKADLDAWLQQHHQKTVKEIEEEM